MSNKAIKLFKDYIVITLAVIIMVWGFNAFKFPNHFSFGGVSGLAVVLNEILGISAAQINLVINLALLVIGFAVLGKSFGLKTAYATVLSSVVLSLMEKMMPSAHRLPISRCWNLPMRLLFRQLQRQCCFT